MYDRKGGLFMNRIRRSKVDKDTDLSNFVLYVHKNAVHHKLAKAIGEWKFDSYNIILSNTNTSLDRDFLFEWFGSRAAFIQFHQQDNLKNSKDNSSNNI